MSVNRDEFNDRDEQAAWELIGRHKAPEPSFGFAERTLRRLQEKPARPRWSWAWSWAAATAVLLCVAGVGYWQSHQQGREEAAVSVYAQTQGADYLEDFDVIASLDELKPGGNTL